MVDEKNIQEEINTEANEINETTASEPTAAESVTAEESNTVTSEGPVDEQLQAANEKISELEAKLGEADNRYYRLQADFENSRRRARLDLEASEKYKSQNLISNLLPAIDNFERALQMEANNEQAKSILQGMEMIYRSILEALKNEGAEQIESVGKEFDPQIHHAVMQVSEEGFESNSVVEEFQKGYKLKDRVIRPAMVKVNQ